MRIFLLLVSLIVAGVFISCDMAPETETYTTYTVTFDSNGGNVITAKKIVENENIPEPNEPTKEDYTFAGWYVDNNSFYIKWSFDVNVVTSNITLYAKWTHTVTFKAGGGLPAPNPQTLNHGDKVTEPANMTQVSNVFEGWYTEPSFQNKWNFSTDIVTSNIILYAKWKYRPYWLPDDLKDLHGYNGTWSYTYSSKNIDNYDDVLLMIDDLIDWINSSEGTNYTATTYFDGAFYGLRLTDYTESDINNARHISENYYSLFKKLKEYIDSLEIISEQSKITDFTDHYTLEDIASASNNFEIVASEPNLLKISSYANVKTSNYIFPYTIFSGSIYISRQTTIYGNIYTFTSDDGEIFEYDYIGKE